MTVSSGITSNETSPFSQWLKPFLYSRELLLNRGRSFQSTGGGCQFPSQPTSDVPASAGGLCLKSLPWCIAFMESESAVERSLAMSDPQALLFVSIKTGLSSSLVAQRGFLALLLLLVALGISERGTIEFGVSSAAW